MISAMTTDYGVLPEVAGSVYSENSDPSALTANNPLVLFVALLSLQTQPRPASAAALTVVDEVRGFIGATIT